MSPPLRPFANVLAVQEPDSQLAREFGAELERSAAFARVRVFERWVIATAPLDSDIVGDAEAESAQLVFAEGRDLFASSGELLRLAECAQQTPAKLATFAGDFGFVSIGGCGLRAVRACGGSVPFYFWRRGPRSAVATRLGFFPRFVDGALKLDPLVAATWATAVDFFPNGRSLLAGVNVLERGHYLRLQPDGGAKVERYWDPRPTSLPKPGPERIREHADTLRSTLLASLEMNLDPGGANLLTLSGGVDSSALAALTGKLGIPTATLSLLPKHNAAYERELAHVERAQRAARLTTARLLRLDAAAWFELQERAPSSAIMVLHPVLCFLPELARELDVRVLFGGEFADTICGSTPTMKDWAAETPLLELLTSLRSLPNGRSDIPDWLRYKVRLWLGRPYTRFPAELGAMIHPDVRAEYAAWASDRSRQVARDPLPRPALPLYAEQVGFVAQNWEVCSELRIRRFFPFFTRPMLELGYACHPSELLGPGSKKVLKAALQDLVSSEIIGRKDKGFWGPALKQELLPWAAPLDPELSQIIRPDWTPKPPAKVRFLDALALQALVNILAALRTLRNQGSTER